MIRFDTNKDYEKYCKEQEELVELEIENKKLKSVLDEIRKIIETEKRLMKYAIYDGCLLLIEEQLDKVGE